MLEPLYLFLTGQLSIFSYLCIAAVGFYVTVSLLISPDKEDIKEEAEYTTKTIGSKEE